LVNVTWPHKEKTHPSEYPSTRTGLKKIIILLYIQRKTEKTFRKPGELFLSTTLKDYLKLWLLGTKLERNKRWLNTFVQLFMYFIVLAI